MKVAYLIVLLIIMLLSLFGVIAERKDERLRDNLTIVLTTAMISFIVSMKWL